MSEIRDPQEKTLVNFFSDTVRRESVWEWLVGVTSIPPSISLAGCSAAGRGFGRVSMRRGCCRKIRRVMGSIT